MSEEALKYFKSCETDWEPIANSEDKMMGYCRYTLAWSKDNEAGFAHEYRFLPEYDDARATRFRENMYKTWGPEMEVVYRPDLGFACCKKESIHVEDDEEAERLAALWGTEVIYDSKEAVV